MAASVPDLTPTEIVESDRKYRWVRMHPYDGKVYLRKMLVIGGRSFVGGDRPEWHRIDVEQVPVLAERRQHTSNPESAPVFQICTYQEMRQVTYNEQRALLGIGDRGQMQADLSRPQVVTNDRPQPVKFTNTLRVDPLGAPLKGQAVAPQHRGDLTLDEVKAGENKITTRAKPAVAAPRGGAKKAPAKAKAPTEQSPT